MLFSVYTQTPVAHAMPAAAQPGAAATDESADTLPSGRELTEPERRDLLAHHMDVLAQLARDAGIEMPMVRRYVLAERLPLDWHLPVTDAQSLESAIQLHAPDELGLEPTTVRDAIRRFVASMGHAAVPTVVIHRSEPYMRANTAIREALAAHAKGSSPEAISDIAAATLARGSLQAAERIGALADDIAQALILLRRHGLDESQFFEMYDFDGEAAAAGTLTLREDLQSLIDYCTTRRLVNESLFDALTAMQRGLGVPSETDLQALNRICTLKKSVDTTLRIAMVRMQEGRGPITEGDWQRMEQQCIRAGGGSRMDRELLLDMARLRAGRGVMSDADFERTLGHCTDGTGRYYPKVFRFLVSRHSGQGLVAQDYVDRIAAMCTTADGNVDGEAMQAIAEAYFGESHVNRTVFDTLLDHCTDGDGHVDRLLLRIAKTMDVPLGGNAVSMFDNLVLRCTPPGEPVNRALLEAVAHRDIGRLAINLNVQDARAMLHAACDDSGRVNLDVFRLLAAMARERSSTPPLERLRAWCGGDGQEVDWQAMRMVAETYAAVDFFSPSVFGELMSQCMGEDGRADLLLVRALRALAHASDGNVFANFGTLLTACRTEDGQLNRGMLEDVITHPEVLRSLSAPGDALSMRRLLTDATDPAGRLDVSVFLLLVRMEEGTGSPFIDRLRTLCADGSGGVD